MERAGRLLRKLKNPGAHAPPDELVRAAWPAAVGSKIAGHTRFGRLSGSTLVMETEDVIWQRQLSTLSPHILRALEKVIGGGIVAEVQFRVGIPRRPPVREQRIADEADGIIDPVLRRIYIQSRGRASS